MTLAVAQTARSWLICCDKKIQFLSFGREQRVVIVAFRRGKECLCQAGLGGRTAMCGHAAHLVAEFSKIELRNADEGSKRQASRSHHLRSSFPWHQRYCGAMSNQMRVSLLPHQISSYSSVVDIHDDQIGSISTDRTAVIGRSGWLFIFEGSNGYRQAYQASHVSDVGDRWVEIIHSRRRLCSRLGIAFLQVIVPNKATILPGCYPIDLGDGITSVLKRIISVGSSPDVLVPLCSWRESAVCESVFRRNDSHLAMSGNADLAERIIRTILGDMPNVEYISSATVSHAGDLGSKFTNPVLEWLHIPRWNEGLLNQRYVRKSHEVVSKGLVGNRQDFDNPSASINMCVLIFGNSFFERCPSWGLTPIFCAIFSRIVFVWSPNVDENIIREVRPDILVAQTCERFLGAVASK